MTEQEFWNESARLEKAELLRNRISKLEFNLRVYDECKRIGRIAIDEKCISQKTVIDLQYSVPEEVHHGIAGVLRGWLSRLKAELEAL